ncbi:hypothetical protein BROUX41_005192 [Berkeleyomyces rouxiae]|uniref:uncharacterized protein n=1 Tax=Berkeleyomyces rouxiae TaxID=2035830 RepID=UPI003B7E6F78
MTRRPAQSPRLRPSHFLCIPLATHTSRPQLQRSLAAFRAHAAATPALGIPTPTIRPLGTIHLTLGVMDLATDPAALARACRLLASVRPAALLDAVRSEVSGAALVAPALSISLTGLHPMHEMGCTSVLYAHPSDSASASAGVLERFCARLRQVFIDAGLMDSERERALRLHATLVNTVYLPGQGRGRGRGQRVMLDARAAVDWAADVQWMRNVPVEQVAICRMGALPVGGEDGEAYVVEAAVRM